MADQGNAYIYNMCDQSVTVTLNEAPDTKGSIDAIAQSAPYTPTYHTAPRNENPEPFEAWEFGGGDAASANKLLWYLGTDRADTRSVTLSLTQNQLHLEHDCEIYLFYDAAVLRWEGDSNTVQATIGPS
jgi:hypothetical protein